jgi:MFS family permease
MPAHSKTEIRRVVRVVVMTEDGRQTFGLARCLVILAVAIAMFGSSAPSPIYGLYQHEFHFGHAMLTAIYGAYSVGTLFALFLLGRISDRIGDRRLLLFAGLGAVILGAVVMAVADNVPLLLIGRFLAGMGTGCVMGPATAALVELDPARDRVRAAVIATVAVTAGITAGVIVTGIALESHEAPTVTPYAVLGLSTFAILIGLRAVRWAPRDAATAHAARPEEPAKPGAGALIREAGWPFAISCAGMATAWMVGGCFLGLGPIFARRLAHIHDPALAGMTVAAFQIVAGGAQLGLRTLPPRRLMVTGTALMASGLLLATLAAALGSAALFCAGALFTGAGYGCGFSGAAAIGTRSAPARGRATIVSFTYIAGYLGNLLPVLSLGVVADHFGLFAAMASLAGAATLFGGGLAAAALLAAD